MLLWGRRWPSSACTLGQYPASGIIRVVWRPSASPAVLDDRLQFFAAKKMVSAARPITDGRQGCDGFRAGSSQTSLHVMLQASPQQEDCTSSTAAAEASHDRACAGDVHARALRSMTTGRLLAGKAAVQTAAVELQPRPLARAAAGSMASIMRGLIPEAWPHAGVSAGMTAG